jgi:predicted phosphodiesterase
VTRDTLRVAILSDIHALATVFEQALEAACAEGFDRMVILGDLLGYGVEVSRTIDLAREAQDRHGAAIIIGNHDQLYFDLAEGRGDYLIGKPDWIVESARWTHEQLQGAQLSNTLDWSEQCVVENILIAHANPYAFGDWTYVRDEDSARDAAERLEERGFVGGIFGHVHRFRSYDFDRLPRVVTVGSIGQPRERGAAVPQWAMAHIGRETFDVDARPLTFDPATYARMLAETSLSAETRDKLESFFE